jgi:glycosyltransferase involved in cell wall biosynthesis
MDRFQPNQNEVKETGRIVYVGRLSTEKNVGLLIEAIRKVPEARLWIVGSGPLEGEYRARAAGLSVDFLGALPNNQVANVLNRAQIFAFPSKYEGSPKALLEAMAAGLAVIGGDVPGVRDLVRHEETGLIADLTPGAFARAMQRLMWDRQLANRLGATARSFVTERYSREAVVQHETEALKRLLLAKWHRCSAEE